jgi:branched-chain amino acid aminotransferase
VTEPSGDVIWIDGTLHPSENATVHVFSHGVQRGSTVFDVMRVVHLDTGPSVFGLREHMARFMNSMGLMGMTPAHSLPDLERAVAETVRANPTAEVVKVAAAWVEVPLRSLPVSTIPSIYVAALTPSATPDPGGGLDTVKLRTATAPKLPSSVLPPSLKVAASYTAGVRERLAAQGDGFDDVVFRTVAGDLAEGTTQSLFVIRDGGVLLPPLDEVLDGITRRAVIDLIRHAGVMLDVRPVYWDEVTSADELFLCSTLSQVHPVSRLDDRELPAPGPISEHLSKAMGELLAGSHDLSRRWLAPLT